jgi:hypothetical protein
MTFLQRTIALCSIYSSKFSLLSSKKMIFSIYVALRCSRGQLKYDGTRAEIRFRLSAKRTSSFKLAGASVQSTTGSRGVRISGSNAGYTMFRGSVKSTGYPLHSPVSPSLNPPVRHRVPSRFNWALQIILEGHLPTHTWTPPHNFRVLLL